MNGKVVVISGAGSGFGRSMSKAFCKAGARVVGLGRRLHKLEETARIAGDLFTPMVWDVTKTADAPVLIEDVARKYGAAHVLINAAAVMADKGVSLSKLSQEAWDVTWKTNVFGAWALTQAAFVAMKRQKYGRVLNVTSGLGFFPMLEYGSYCVSKAALNMMTRVFAIDGARDNVLVNAIDPGVARTEMNPTASDSPDTINRVALFLASLPDKGHTGKCFNKKLQLVEW